MANPKDKNLFHWPLNFLEWLKKNHSLSRVRLLTSAKEMSKSARQKYDCTNWSKVFMFFDTPKIMKVIGMIAGVTWVSSVEYYRIINEYVSKELGKHNSANMIINSLNCQEETKFMEERSWNEMAEWATNAAKRVEKGGADFLIMCSNTLHKVANEVSTKIGIPILSIIDVTAKEIEAKSLKKVGLLGTNVTMKEGFYKDRLAGYGIEVVVPEERDMEIINRIIMNELAFKEIRDSSRKECKAIIKKLISKGAEGIILGCTELPLLIKQKDVKVLVFDTTQIHALAAAKLAIQI
jgi:aspartate racemase